MKNQESSFSGAHGGVDNEKELSFFFYIYYNIFFLKNQLAVCGSRCPGRAAVVQKITFDNNKKICYNKKKCPFSRPAPAIKKSHALKKCLSLGNIMQ